MLNVHISSLTNDGMIVGNNGSIIEQNSIQNSKPLLAVQINLYCIE